MDSPSTSYAERVTRYKALIKWYEECHDDEFVAFLRGRAADGSFGAFETMRSGVLDKVDLLAAYRERLTAGEVTAIQGRLALAIRDAREFMVHASFPPVTDERLSSLPIWLRSFAA